MGLDGFFQARVMQDMELSKACKERMVMHAQQMKAGTPAATTKLVQNPCYANNKHLQLTDVGHWQRGRIAQMYPEYRSVLGMRSFNFAVQLLPHLSTRYSFVIPLAHLLLRGVVRDLWTHIFGAKSSKQWIEPRFWDIVSHRSALVGRVLDMGAL